MMKLSLMENKLKYKWQNLLPNQSKEETLSNQELGRRDKQIFQVVHCFLCLSACWTHTVNIQKKNPAPYGLKK